MNEINELNATQTTLANAIAEHPKMAAKVIEYNESVADSRRSVDLLVTEREAAERDLVRGKSTPAAVAAIDKKLKEAKEKLESFERLLTFSKEELLSIDNRIVTARQQLANARFAFCIAEKNRLADELNGNQAFKKLMIAVYAANASNNLRYTANWKMFVAELIEEVPATELAAAKSDFLKKHNLAD
ncbi:hypothetical protein [Nitrosomonas sp.]|uniref:hypothetical protein n=1 Tax=Nitrosomonas sp. TaxID=42353 RepID=UPI00374DFACD